MLHVVLYHDAVIPPPKYGGTERVLYWLAQALVSLGHRVTLLARAGSTAPGAEVIALDGPAARGRDWRELIPRDADIVHLQATPRSEMPRPFLVTIHGNGQPGESFHRNTVFLSKKHAENHGSPHYVYNGINPAEYPCDLARTGELVFLAKASWNVKNLRGAIEVARASGKLLHVLGSRDWPLRLQRHLPAWRGVRYHGMVDDTAKKQLLRGASGLLFPVRWHEPFGLAVIEALASGVPVFATPYGSLPELVTPEVGVLADSAAELVRAVSGLATTPAGCRAVVEAKFTHLHMARGYLAYYSRILDGGELDTLTPRTGAALERGRKELLPWR